MFKKGDKIAYLHDKLNIVNLSIFYKEYKLENLYNIKEYYTFDRYNLFNPRIIYLEDFPKPVEYSFFEHDFMLLSDYRKIKLRKINETMLLSH